MMPRACGRWRRIGDKLGRLPETCRDRWRKLELGEAKRTGAWRPQEVQALQAAVAQHQADREVQLSYLSSGEGSEAVLCGVFRLSSSTGPKA